MSIRRLALASVLLLAPHALAQAPAPYSAPRTAAGHPDFGGTWGTSFLTPLERPPGVKDLVVHPDAATKFSDDFRSHVPAVIDPDFQVSDVRALASVRGELRSSMIVTPADGQIPFSPKAEKLARLSAELEETAFDGPEQRPTSERCLAGIGQAPIRQLPAFIPTLIVQTPSAMVLATEDVGAVRIIHLDGSRPPPDALRTFEGWSAGRWDGDTLVVETTHSRADDPFRSLLGRPVIVEPDSKVIERFTLLSDRELLYQFTVEDADLYIAPWLGEYVFVRSDKVWYEYACHEGNYAMVNMLVAGRLGRQPAKKN
jgi:hypothetical protein